MYTFKFIQGECKICLGFSFAFWYNIVRGDVCMKKLDLAVEKYRDKILEAERYVWNNPETGYKEYKTSAYMEKTFRELGYDLVMADGITAMVIKAVASVVVMVAHPVVHIATKERGII